MEQIWQTLKETLNFSTKRMEREDLLQWGSWPNLQKTQEQDFEQELTVGRATLLQQSACSYQWIIANTFVSPNTNISLPV